MHTHDTNPPSIILGCYSQAYVFTRSHSPVLYWLHISILGYLQLFCLKIEHCRDPFGTIDMLHMLHDSVSVLYRFIRDSFTLKILNGSMSAQCVAVFTLPRLLTVELGWCACMLPFTLSEHNPESSLRL